ncbi:FliA/WhiG family RNA polymerase sigma factor [Thiohalorhabdus methylotrophus]|uniref:FliA/WhiG family RNA polymerase sigma factor n=1 Tax=Thiohalorhabdus methylotrophus TaxID=3242694 RepID=A0ABV4TVW3_9GAMM
MNANDPDSLLERYGEVIYYHAERLAPRLPNGLERGDLLNAGMVALIQAAGNFDPARGVQFRTFADYRVRGAMIDEMRRADWMGTETRRRAHMLEDAFNALEQKHGRPAQSEEVAGYLGISQEEYFRLLSEVRGMSLLSMEDLELPEEDLPAGDLADWLHRGNESEAFQALRMDEIVDNLAAGLEELPNRERLVLTLYYYEELTMKEVGQVLEITESRVSQLHTQAVLRLRGRLGMDGREEDT